VSEPEAKPEGDRIYAAAHSLGPSSREVAQAIAAAVDYWGDRLVDGWDDWLDLACRVGDRLGTAALGAAPGQVIVGDSTSVNIYKLASAALDARPARRAIVVDDDEFPTDRYVVEGLAAARGLELRSEIDADAALVCRSLVDFRTSTVADAVAYTAAAHDAGALMLWDVSHAVGVMPVGLDALGADLAVGCTYKWLRSGPGAPAFLYVRADLHTAMRQPIWGWFGQRDQFEMGSGYDPEPDIRRFQVGTPPILGLAGVDAAAGAVEKEGIDAIRARSQELTSRFIDAIGDVEAEIATPLESARRGGHVAVRVGDAAAVRDALAQRNVIVDIRRDLVRFGFHPLSTSDHAVDAAAEAFLRARLASG
jgi:kynureninase